MLHMEQNIVKVRTAALVKATEILSENVVAFLTRKGF